MTAPYTRHLLIVIPAALQSTYNAAALQYDPEGGQFTFTVPLFPQGGPYDAPVAYWACPALQEDVYQQLIAAYAPQIQASTIHVYDYNTTTPAAVLAALGLETQPEEMLLAQAQSVATPLAIEGAKPTGAAAKKHAAS